jgi:hypothetical protein
VDDYVRRTLLWRLQILDGEMQHMAEDIVEIRENLKNAEEQLVLMDRERTAIADYLANEK